MYDIIYQQETMTTTSMRPRVQQILDRELTLLAEIYLKIE